MATLQKYKYTGYRVKLLLLIALMLTVLTGWNLEDGLQEMGEGIRNGVKGAEQAVKQTPAAISEAGNKIEDDIKQEDADEQDSEKDN